MKAFKQGVTSWEESERKKKKNIESFEKIISDKVTADKENGTENNELSNEIDMVESAILDDIVKPVKTKKAKKKRTDSENANNTTKKVKKSKKNKESMND